MYCDLVFTNNADLMGRGRREVAPAAMIVEQKSTDDPFSNP